MLVGDARDYRVSDVHKSSQASFAVADDARLQLTRELNDTADRLRQIDLVSPDGAQSSLGRQSGCDVLDEAEANTTREALFASRSWGLAHLDELAAAAAQTTGVSLTACRAYLSGLDYALSSKHLAGLTDFFRRLAALGLVPDGSLQFVQVA